MLLDISNIVIFSLETQSVLSMRC